MAAPDKPSHPLRSFALLVLLCLVESAVGFTADLIHRDSPPSPLRDPFTTLSDRMRGAARRSVSRACRLWAGHSPEIRSEMAYSGGEYYMKVSIGSPPVETLAIADTGSDLSWTQCEPCVKCYRQKPPIFNPRNSSTYKTVQCPTRLCKSLDGARCGGGDNGRACRYNYTYGDGSFTSGDVAMETFRIGTLPGSTIAVPRIAFGCGYDNGGIFPDVGSGIIGLGGGPFSMISQMEGFISGQFGYCLVPEFRNGTSKISFGKDATVSGPGAVSTALISKTPDTYYYVNLEGLSVGKERLSCGNNSADSEAEESIKTVDMMIDSGTTLTFVPSQFFHKLERAVADAIRLPRIPDPHGMLDLCYRSPGGEIDVPVITLHFAGGADMALKGANTFAQFAEDLVCFTIMPTDSVPILGNLAQMEFKVGFDVRKRTVSFVATDCTAQWHGLRRSCIWEK